MAKDVMEHLADFWEGVKSLHGGAYDFGDYLARVSGFRDWQEQSDSVMYDGVVLYVKQNQATQETKLFVEAAKSEELYPLYWEALKCDAQDRPAYYVGSLLTGFAAGKVMASKQGAITLTVIKASGLSADAVHEVMEELRNQLGVTKEEFSQLMNSGILQEKIKEELGDKIHYQDGTLYIVDKDGKGYKLENNEWKEFDNSKDKLLIKDGDNWKINNTGKDNTISSNNKATISADLEEFMKSYMGKDTLSDEFKYNLKCAQDIFEVSDDEMKDCMLNPQVTQEELDELSKELENKEKKELEAKNDKTKDNSKDNEEDNVRRMEMRKA
jgi:hypothetical protein